MVTKDLAVGNCHRKLDAIFGDDAGGGNCAMSGDVGKSAVPGNEDRLDDPLLRGDFRGGVGDGSLRCELSCGQCFESCDEVIRCDLLRSPPDVNPLRQNTRRRGQVFDCSFDGVDLLIRRV
jgi:hypothetical protein